MLRGYYDGSGKAGQSAFLTLAGLIASESVWGRFEQSWGEVLDRFKISHFHMSEAMSLRGRFSVDHGWNRKKVNELTKELWNVIGKYRWVENFSLGSNLFARSCTVVMEDYRNAKLANPKLREPEALCTQFCFGALPPDLDSNVEHPEIRLVFDRGEPFLNTIYRNWIKYKDHAKAGWPKQIKDIVFGSAYMPPLQAADLLAWTINKHHREPDGYPYAIGSVIMLSHQTKTYDFGTLMKGA